MAFGLPGYIYIYYIYTELYRTFFETLRFFLGGGNSKIYYFHPEPWGNDPIWRLHIFQMGWFNHQPVLLLNFQAFSSPFQAWQHVFQIHGTLGRKESTLVDTERKIWVLNEKWDFNQPKMDGENNGKWSYFSIDDFGGKIKPPPGLPPPLK